MLEYNLDISSQSSWNLRLPDESSRDFALYATEYGYYEAGREYFTRRDGKGAALLIYTVGGQGEIQQNGQSCLLNENTAIIIYCDSFHQYRTASAKPWSFYWVHLGGAGLSGYRSPLIDRLTPVAIQSPEVMRLCFEELYELDAHPDIVSFAEMSHSLSTMLVLMIRALTREEGASLRRKDVGRLAEYIMENHAQPLTAEDFARVANLSKYHLIRVFRQQMGVPPYRYLHLCRIGKARELLRTSTDMVAEIGAKVGYPDLVNFIRHFKDITGTTPAKYRRESLRMP